MANTATVCYRQATKTSPRWMASSWERIMVRPTFRNPWLMELWKSPGFLLQGMVEICWNVQIHGDVTGRSPAAMHIQVITMHSDSHCSTNEASPHLFHVAQFCCGVPRDQVDKLLYASPSFSKSGGSASSSFCRNRASNVDLGVVNWYSIVLGSHHRIP